MSLNRTTIELFARPAATGIEWPAVSRAAEAVATYGLVAIILAMPLEFTSTLFRLQLVRIVMAIVALAFAYLVVMRRKAIAIPTSISALLLGAYVAASVMSWMFTRAPGSLTELLAVIAYPIFGVLVVSLVRSEKDQSRAWSAFLISGAGIGLLSLFLYYTHLSIWRPDPSVLGRVNATFGDPNITARFLTVAVMGATMMFASRKTKHWLAVATVVTGAAAVPITFSRSGFLLFVIAVALAVAVSVDRRRAARIATLGLAVFAVAILVNADARERAILAVQPIIDTVTNQSRSAKPLGGVALDSNRSFLIAAGIQMFVDHPIAGVGYGGFQHALLTDYKRFFPPVYADTLSHTSAVSIIAEQGLIGSLLFGAFAVAVGFEAVRRRHAWGREWIVPPAVLLVPLFLFSQFEGRLISEPYLWLMLGLFYAAMALKDNVSTEA